MSMIDQTVNPIVGGVPLTRRISELMHEKGDGFTIRAFAPRLGISREYLRLMLCGERTISPAMLEKICQGLGVSVVRLKKMDTLRREQDLRVLLNANTRTKPMMIRAHQIATELVQIAKGATERGVSLSNLGRVLFFQQKYDEAHQAWLGALKYAQELNEMYNEKELLHLVTANLLLTHSIRKEYSNIEEILTLVEKAFPDNPEALGLAFYTRMKMLKERGNFVLARNYATRSLEFYQQTESAEQIGKALINLAYCEYLLGNYDTSAKILTEAIDMVQGLEYTLLFAVKEYVKTLMKQRKYKKAIRTIDEYLSLANDYPEIYRKFQIMYTTLKDDPSYAERVSNDANATLNVRFLACKCLFEFYARKGDSELALLYYEKGKVFSNTKTEFYEEEGF